MKSNLIGIDLAKNVFQVCALNRAGKVQSNVEVRRARLLQYMATFEPTIIAMESCSSAHFWARRMQSFGHEVRLLPAQRSGPHKLDSPISAASAHAAFLAAD